jgi:hypothetical protein
MMSVGGKAFLYGGVDSSGAFGPYFSDAWEFDGSTWSLVTFTGPWNPPGLANFGMSAYGSGAVILGGLLDLNPGAGPNTNVWIWDGSSWMGTPLISGRTPDPRIDLGMAAHGTGLVLFGGNSQGAAPAALGDTWSYDASGWTLLNVTGPSARYGHAMATIQ